MQDVIDQDGVGGGMVGQAGRDVAGLGQSAGCQKVHQRAEAIVVRGR